MDRRMVSKGLMMGAASLGLAPMHVWADDSKERLLRFLDHDHDSDEERSSVTVSFGAGLNTAQPGNAANHHILPREIKVNRNGVVNFIVAGFHQIIVFDRGVVQGQIAVPLASLFIYDPAPPSSLPVLYLGVRTAGGPPPVIAPTPNPSNAANRVESVSFANTGNYLVICNVRQHFIDGMWAMVKVR